MPVLLPFNKPYFSGNETRYIEQTVRSGKIYGDDLFTQRVHRFFEEQLGFHKALLTTSGTDALKLAALLLNIKPGDEVIMPSFTFVSAANAFVLLLRGAKVVFVDSTGLNLNLDAAALEGLVTPYTRAIVPVHYASFACDMDQILAVATRHRLAVVEDAANAIDSYHRGHALGSVDALAAFSFQETKNIISGEGGLLAINDARFGPRAEVMREKGTTHSALFGGEIDKYGWVDIESSFLPFDIIAAYLWAQLENLADIQRQRRAIWQRYYRAFESLISQGIGLPILPEYATNNGHLFYLVCGSLVERTALILHLKQAGNLAVFHYLPLHNSTYCRGQHDGRALPLAGHYAERLLRLPLFYKLTNADRHRFTDAVLGFYQQY